MDVVSNCLGLRRCRQKSIRRVWLNPDAVSAGYQSRSGVARIDFGLQMEEGDWSRSYTSLNRAVAAKTLSPG